MKRAPQRLVAGARPAAAALSAPAALAFCGFYVAKADAKLFNKASQVVLVRDGDRTVLTMANDFQGRSQGVRDGGAGADGARAGARSTSATRR